MRVLVTGATGFLGHHLVPCLRQAGHTVRALLRPGSEAGFLAGQGVELAYAADISDRPAVIRAAADCEAVVHAAGHFRFWGDLPTFWQTNVAGTAATLEAAARAGARRYIYISTVAVVGRPERGRTIDESHPCHPRDHYQRTKLEAELLVQAFHRERQLPALILRPGAYYGPWGRYAFNRLFFEEPLRGWRVRVNRGRHITFPVYAPDVARAVDLALAQGQPGRIYNVAGASLSHNAINAMVSDLAGISRWRLDVPAGGMLALARVWTWLSRYTGREPFYPINLAPYVFADWVVSSRRAETELGWRATPFTEGARATVAWYRETLLAGRRPKDMG